MNKGVETRYFFDDFEIDGERRILLKGGRPVALKPKGLDLLLALVENHGIVVSKNDLLDAVWQDQFVEEKNLSVHIAAIRKALGERKDENRFIATVAGTGYKFVAPLEIRSNSILVEKQTIQHIDIEDELTEDPGQTNGVQHRLRTLAFYVLSMAFLLLVGGYVWQSGRTEDHAASSVRRLTTNGNVQLATLSSDGKLFAYVTDDLGQTSLWLGYTAGGNNIQLRPLAGSVYGQLTFSPDGNQLYFSIRGEHDQEFSVFRMPSFGGAPDKIIDGTGHFSLSPDGRQLAVVRVVDDGSVSLRVLELDTKSEREFLSVPRSESLVDGSVSWSPDGKQMAFSCNRQSEMYSQDLCLADISSRSIERIPLPNYRSILKTVWPRSGDSVVVTAIPAKNLSSVVNYQILRVELSNGKIHEVTNDLNTYNADISVSNDSRSLLTIEHRQLNNIWVAPADDLSRAKQITFGSFGRYDGLWGLDWTPDGRIVFTNSSAETQHISAMDPDGTNRTDLTSPGFMDSALTVSNDGRYVVFHSARGGVSDIWRMNIDGSDLKQLTFGSKSFQPSFSADSRYVYYKSWLGGVGELRRVPVEGGEPEAFTDKQTSWSTFSPDGRLFAAAYRTDRLRLAIFSTDTNRIIKQFDVPESAAFDMRPRWTPDGMAVVYRDGRFGYWRQSLDNQEAERMSELPLERLYTFAWSKDGKQFAFVRGQEIRDVVLISDFR